ncbi:hypothetical protein [Actinoplanes sp. NPDC089786]|uniref:hypothetical protein n=1 Tax=Actinoplanes sp. NPDC089786 TaxID=3155185 RepID=UPI003413EBB9
MRRLLLLLPLLFSLPIAACSSSPDAAATTATPGAIPPPATAAAPSGAPAKAAGGDAALSKDTKAICTQADKVTAQFGATFTRDLKVLTGATDAVKAEVEQKTKRDVQNFSFVLKDLSTLAGDAGLKKALGEMSTEVKALNGDVRKLDADKLGELSGTLDKACGRG